LESVLQQSVDVENVQGASRFDVGSQILSSGKFPAGETRTAGLWCSVEGLWKTLHLPNRRKILSTEDAGFPIRALTLEQELPQAAVDRSREQGERPSFLYAYCLGNVSDGA
jgi:hypothetical protein